MTHDWDAINRAISESIEREPAPFSGVPVGVSKIHWSPQFAWKYRWYYLTSKRMEGNPEPRDWREPAAAMELLKRNQFCVKFIPRHSDVPECWRVESIRLGPLATNEILEDAIVLASYAAIAKAEAKMTTEQKEWQ